MFEPRRHRTTTAVHHDDDKHRKDGEICNESHYLLTTMKFLLSLLLLVAPLSGAFVVRPSTAPSTTTALGMGLFDGIMKAFENESVRKTMNQ